MGHLLDSDSAEYEVIRAQDSTQTARLLELGRISPLYTLMQLGNKGRYESLLYFAVNQGWADGVALCILYGGDPSAAEAHRPKTARAYAQDNVHRGHDGEHGQYMLALVGGRPVDAPLIAGQGVTALMYAAEYGHAYALQLLLQRYGADVRLRNPMTGANALYYAMQRVDGTLQYMRLQRLYSAAADLDPCLAILVGPLDPVEYQSRFRHAMDAIRRYARSVRKP